MDKRVVIRVDASVYIGTGHVMRCLALAGVLKANGFNISFACRPQVGDLIHFVEAKGYPVFKLSVPASPVVPKNNSDYSGWLQVPVISDANDFLTLVEKTDLVVVDHYGLDLEWEKMVRFGLDCKILAIDDLLRPHFSDLIVDQTLYRSAGEYSGCAPHTNVLSGCEYVLIPPKFAKYRERAHDLVVRPKLDRVLISMGGIDQPNATLKVLKEIHNHYSNTLATTVLLSKNAPNYDNVAEFCAQNISWIRHIDFTENMADLMLEHSFAIGAPGTTSWERACVGLPNIVVPLAENQNGVAKALVESGASLLVEQDEISENLSSAIEDICENWIEYRKANLRICDGLGLKRIVLSVKKILGYLDSKVVIRIATTEDIKQVYEWQKRVETRKYSLNKRIPCWKEHELWMVNKLASLSDYFYIAEMAGAAVGVVRLDRVALEDYIISIYVDPELHGRGIAKSMLHEIIEIHSNVSVTATVLAENIASQNLFSNAGFRKLTNEKFVRERVN